MAQSRAAEFENAIVPHLSAAFHLARWLTRDSGQAEDLVQESYLKAFRFFDSFQGGDGRAWIMAIVRNTCFTWLQKNKAQAASGDAFDERLHSDRQLTVTVEESLMEKADLDTLRGCIEVLPLEYREAIVMRELQEFSYKQISEITSVPVGTVMSRLSRARKRLEDCVTRKAGGKL